MHTVKEIIIESLCHAFTRAFPYQSGIDAEVSQSVTISTQEHFGHYQCNAAMRLAKRLKLNPRQIAESCLAFIENTAIEKCEVAGPGFINVWLKASFITERCQMMLTDETLGVRKRNQPHRVVVDFSSPNIAKEMHVGHLRSTILGDCIANLFELRGDDVLRLNHVGDWGTAFGMLIVYLLDSEPGVLNGEKSANLSELVVWYKAAKKRFDDDAQFKKRAQMQVVKLQQGDAASLAAWHLICDISRQGFEVIYSLLDVKLQERGESFYNDQLASTVEELSSKGLVEVSDGAKCIYFDGFMNRDNEPLPLIIQKSDGGYNYATTDLAALKHRVAVEKADRIVYFTDIGQSTHFAQVFMASKRAGFYDPQLQQVEHAGFGLVLGEDGKKFRTRAGEVVRLQDLLSESIERASKLLEERELDWGVEEKAYAAKVLGIGAVKYADLSTSRQSDYKFSFDRMLQFEGNTAAAILYAYVRIQSIKRKIDNSSFIDAGTLSLCEPAEVSLGIHLARFSDVIEKVLIDLMPHYLTDYLFATAQKFNAFFRDCRVSGSDQENSRVLLCELTANVLKLGLNLLGIQTLDRM